MKYFITFFIINNVAFAETFQVSGQNLSFENHNGLLLQGCETKKCEALKTISYFKKIDLKKIRRKQTSVASVGSDVCKLVYKAGSVIGIADNKDQRAFCVFRDNSAVEINSLSNYLIQNQILK